VSSTTRRRSIERSIEVATVLASKVVDARGAHDGSVPRLLLSNAHTQRRRISALLDNHVLQQFCGLAHCSGFAFSLSHVPPLPQQLIVHEPPLLSSMVPFSHVLFPLQLTVHATPLQSTVPPLH
jgi:hypothetical protein